MKSITTILVICVELMCATSALMCYQQQKIVHGLFVNDDFKLGSCPPSKKGQTACLRTEKHIGDLGGYVVHGQCVSIETCQNISSSALRVGGVGSEIILDNTYNVTCCHTDGCNLQTVEAIIASRETGVPIQPSTPPTTNMSSQTTISAQETTDEFVDNSAEPTTAGVSTVTGAQSTSATDVASAVISSTVKPSPTITSMLLARTTRSVDMNSSSLHIASFTLGTSQNNVITSTTKTGNSSSNLFPSVFCTLCFLLYSFRHCL